jgi:glycosyltransferase involved in cell wall biosynthesis
LALLSEMRLPSDIRAPIPVLHLSLDAQWEIPPPAPGFSVYWRDDVPVGAVKAFNADTFISDCAQFGKPATVPAPPFGRGPPASVIICTRDRPDQLARCLVSFKDQTVVPSEVIVIDNASVDDRTRNVALKAGVRYIREDRPGLDIARNTGAAVASCPILVYTDDDTVLHPAWLERMVAAFDDPAIWAVTGLVLPAELETAAQAVFEKAWGGLGKGYERRDYGPAFYEQTRRKGCPAWEIGAGASMAFRREVFDRLGGFDERLDVGAAGCSGDSEYWHRILCAGGVCRYEPSAVLYHYHQREFEGLARQLRAYMRGHVAALLVQYERSGEWGNLRRLLLSLPHWYARKLSWRLAGVYDSSACLVGEEIRGMLEGVAYYLACHVKADSPKAAPSIVP